MGNATLNHAKMAKRDEFYTTRSTVEDEMVYYGDFFRDKTVYCNADNPYESEFFRFFVRRFRALGLRKLIATCYGGTLRPLDLLTLAGPNPTRYIRTAYKAIVTDVADYAGDDGEVDTDGIQRLLLDARGRQNPTNSVSVLEWHAGKYGPGDFRSNECVKLLDEADIVVTNPPFSLFREYVAQLIEHDKKFIILGNVNAVTYKEVFPLITQNRMWLGNNSGTMSFKVPSYYESRTTGRQDESGQKWRSMGNICWCTNLSIEKHHEELILVKRYKGHEDEYPKYDNYDAINVDKTVDIPEDYAGAMGVPISFLDKYNPDQFEIIGGFDASKLEEKAEFSLVPSANTPYLDKHGNEGVWNGPIVNRHKKYYRVVIRNRHPEPIRPISPRTHTKGETENEQHGHADGERVQRHQSDTSTGHGDR